MSRLLTALLGVSVCAFAQTSALSLHLPNAESQPASVIDAAKAEVSRVLGRLSMDLNWRTAPEAGGEEALLVVVRFAGSCSFSTYNPAKAANTAPGLPLASTAVSDGRVLPFVTVECNRVRDRIAPQTIGLRDSERSAALGKAIGRVLAHEIYHVMTGDRKHAREGVAASCVSARQLLADRFDLDDESIAQMRPPRPEPVIADDELDTGASGR
jgi:hypothetical protein